MNITHASFRSSVLALTLAALAGLHADAQTWDGGDANNYWTNAPNWVGDVVPAQDSAILFNNAAAPNLNNTLGQTFAVKSLTFGAAQTAPVTITTTSTNESLMFNPGTVLTVTAGDHKVIGPAGGVGTLGAIVFTNAALPVLNVLQAGNVLTFSWPAASAQYRLQAQTNALNVGISGAWSDYPGGGASPVSVTIDPANPTVFYRLVSTGLVYTFDVASGASFEFAGRLRQAGSAATRNYVKTGEGVLYLSKDNGGGSGWVGPGDTLTASQGILKMDHRARGNSGMKLVVNSGASLQVLGEEAIPNGSVTLAGPGVLGAGALNFVGGLNAGAGTNRIETATVILAADASIGALESGQLNKCGLSGAFTMTKVGAGELELGSTLYMTNATPWAGIVVSNGTLKVSGNMSQPIPITVGGGALRVTASFGVVAGPVNVQAGGKVEGTGTINGTVSVDGELSPGVGSTIPATLTINNSLTLGAGSSTTVQVAAVSNDQVVGLTSVTFGGTLNVADISLGGISPGQVFQLFTATSYNGNFSNIVGTPSIGGAWSFDPATGALTHVP